MSCTLAWVSCFSVYSCSSARSSVSGGIVPLTVSLWCVWCKNLVRRTTIICKKGAARTGLSTRHLGPPVLVPGSVEQAWKGRGPAWQCGCMAHRIFWLERQILSVKVTELKTPGMMSKNSLYGLVAKRQMKKKKDEKLPKKQSRHRIIRKTKDDVGTD